MSTNVSLIKGLWADNLSISLSGEPIVTIHSDGRVEFHNGATTDAAAKAFWDAVKTMNFLPSVIAKEKERCAAICDAYAQESAGFTEEAAAAEKLAELIRK